jgi:hypothetical protein
LETICLKCLEKEVDRRYATAEDLADDLRRYLKNEAIKARPIGRLQKGWRWCKRNPVVAGLTAAVAIVLVVGTGISSYFAVVADQRADVANEKTEEALEQKARADDQAAEAIRQRNRADEEAERRRRHLYISDMNVAMQAWDHANVLRVNELLRRHVPQAGQEDLRGFEWYYLWRLCQRSRNTPRIETGIAGDLAFSPNGKVLAVGHRTAVTLWDVDTQRILDRFQAEEEWPELWGHVEFTPDGKSVIHQTADGKRVRLRSLDGSERPRPLQ